MSELEKKELAEIRKMKTHEELDKEYKNKFLQLFKIDDPKTFWETAKQVITEMHELGISTPSESMPSIADLKKVDEEWKKKSPAEKNEWLEEFLKKNYPEIWSTPVKKKRFFSK